ncbi:hypothetical protein ACIQGZ_00160 [Streptomyces sp. NPDC092296]|uniref:hypothetical protein n=1 Tax=Streptomyces sp. NPDC092296 TaxID=3366012 RepID=UPI0037F19763
MDRGTPLPGRPAGTARAAWLDESFQEQDSAGFYILAAAVIEPDAADTVREAMRGLRGRRATAKAHWTEMDHRDRCAAARLVAGLPGLHVVSVGSPVPLRRQERARSKCLTALVVELHGFGVAQLYMEAREKELNSRDVTTVIAARSGLPKGTRFRVDHVLGAMEPLLWVADVVAGACRAERLGRGEYRDLLGGTVLDFDVHTAC